VQAVSLSDESLTLADTRLSVLSITVTSRAVVVRAAPPAPPIARRSADATSCSRIHDPAGEQRSLRLWPGRVGCHWLTGCFTHTAFTHAPTRTSSHLHTTYCTHALEGASLSTGAAASINVCRCDGKGASRKFFRSRPCRRCPWSWPLRRNRPCRPCSCWTPRAARLRSRPRRAA